MVFINKYLLSNEDLKVSRGRVHNYTIPIKRPVVEYSRQGTDSMPLALNALLHWGLVAAKTAPFCPPLELLLKLLKLECIVALGAACSILFPCLSDRGLNVKLFLILS